MVRLNNHAENDLDSRHPLSYSSSRALHFKFESAYYFTPVIMPIMLLCGVFFPVLLLPESKQVVAMLCR
jgi:hypothetical protein